RIRDRTQTLTVAGLSIALVVVIGGLANVFAARHFRRSDWTHAQVYSISPKTRAILANLTRDVKVTVFMIPNDRAGGNDVYQLTTELLDQLRAKAAGRL